MNRQEKNRKRAHSQEDRKLDVLAAFLDGLAEDGAMNLEELDGFFAALHCCPELVLPSEYLPEVFGSDDLDSEDLFVNEEHAKLMLGLIMDHWNTVGNAFCTKEFFLPLLLEDDQGKARGNDWAIGFLRGVWMRRDTWREILEDENKAGWFVPIFALAHENDPDPEMRPYKDLVTEEQKENLLAGVSAAVTAMYRYFEPHRKREAAGMRKRATPRRREPRIGRNDPCYCGSGKKYKRCCGALKVN